MAAYDPKRALGMVRNKRFYSRVMGVLAVALAANGCAPFTVSLANVEAGAGWSSARSGRGMQLRGPEVDIFVTAGNLVASHMDETKDTVFVVSFYFVPRGEPFQFDPKGAVLTMPDGARLQEQRLEVKYAGYSGASRDCEGYKTWPFQDGPPYTLRGGFCVDYFFPASPPPPEAAFEVKVPALTRNGTRIPIPAIHFKKGSGAFRLISN